MKSPLFNTAGAVDRDRWMCNRLLCEVAGLSPVYLNALICSSALLGM